MFVFTLFNTVTGQEFNKEFNDLKAARRFYCRVKHSTVLRFVGLRTETMLQYAIITGKCYV